MNNSAPKSLEQYGFSRPFELWEAVKELRKKEHTRVNFVLLEGPWKTHPKERKLNKFDN